MFLLKHVVPGRKNKSVFVAARTDYLESPGLLYGCCRKISRYFEAGGLLENVVLYPYRRKQSHPGPRSFHGRGLSAGPKRTVWKLSVAACVADGASV